MPEIVVFHHAQGLTDGLRALADQWRAQGHTVHLPDLFDGRTFTDVESGVAHAKEIGFGNVLERGLAAADGLPSNVVYAGFSMGVMPAQNLAQTRPGCAGALFFDSCMPAAEFGAWPEGLRAQVHGSTDDAWFAEDLEFARELDEAEPSVELFLYSGADHLFVDPSLESHDPAAAQTVLERVSDFLKSLDADA